MPRSKPKYSDGKDPADQPPDVLPLFPEESDAEEVWSGEDLERAYQAAVEALDQLERDLPDGDGLEPLADREAVQSLNDFPRLQADPPPTTDEPKAVETELAVPLPARVTPAQILEAALFVGGMPLTAKRLCAVLRDEFDRDFIERTIDQLNLRYDDENRPYEIRLGEGGYRMMLRPEFESVRNKNFGFGPKEVRLSQDALEVLSLVAYHQPITKEKIEQAGKPKPNGVLRQLLRRELIAIERTGPGANEVTYHTTPRFLQVFGLSTLDELPRNEDLSFK